MDQRMITTAFELNGYKIIENLGVCRGITVRSRDLFSNMVASFRSLAGGKIHEFVELCEQAREEAFIDLLSHADRMGANAVIGFRYDANDVVDGITEVLAYGTAVRVEKI